MLTSEPSLAIPADLDRALARAVLADVRGRDTWGEIATRADVPPAAADAPPVAAALRVAGALLEQGGAPAAVLLALEDAFAALAAAHRHPAQRARVYALYRCTRGLVAAEAGDDG